MVNKKSTPSQALKEILQALKSNLILVGFMGTGKTTTARYLGQQLQWPWLDTDLWIQERYGMSPAEIIRRRGQDYLRSLEDACAQDLPDNGHIIATGGGLVLNPKTAERVKQKGRIIVLEAPAEVIYSRIAAVLSTRPLIDPQRPLASIAETLSARTPLYRKLGPVVCSNAPVYAVAEAVLHCAAHYPPGYMA